MSVEKFSTAGFERWMEEQVPPSENFMKSLRARTTTLIEEQLTILRNYPECETANDLPFDIQEKIIDINENDNSTTTDGNLQGEVDAFLMNQYSLVSRKLHY
jgi:hypothetical protein|tara:strand:- start:644 stop:949 length:306 start_codon:yes stop_codon:yes gene_type:complete